MVLKDRIPFFSRRTHLLSSCLILNPSNQSLLASTIPIHPRSQFKTTNNQKEQTDNLHHVKGHLHFHSPKMTLLPLLLPDPHSRSSPIISKWKNYLLMNSLPRFISFPSPIESFLINALNHSFDYNHHSDKPMESSIQKDQFQTINTQKHSFFFFFFSFFDCVVIIVIIGMKKEERRK